MPIVLENEFHVFDSNYSNFIRRHHAEVLQYCRFHNRMGVVGPVGLTQPWRWSTIRITNDTGRSIVIAKSLESLWLYGYRLSLPPEENNIPNPWRVITDLENGFSGLPGDSASLNFSGKYPSNTTHLNVSKFSLGNAITELYDYARQLNSGKRNLNPDKARKGFVMLILYFAEALKIIPVRDFLETRFAKNDDMVFLPLYCLGLATDWSANSSLFLSGQYVKQELWLVLYPKRGRTYELDGVQPVESEEPEEPENGDDD